MAWSLSNSQRASGFFSFWKSCCKIFLTCNSWVKVHFFSLIFLQSESTLFTKTEKNYCIKKKIELLRQKKCSCILMSWIRNIKGYLQARVPALCRQIPCGLVCPVPVARTWKSNSPPLSETPCGDYRWRLLNSQSSKIKLRPVSLHAKQKKNHYSLKLAIKRTMRFLPDKRMNRICQHDFLHRLVTTL